MSEDPIGLLGGDANFYLYVNNSPINFRDPSGLVPAGNPLVILGNAIGSTIGSFGTNLSQIGRGIVDNVSFNSTPAISYESTARLFSTPASQTPNSTISVPNYVLGQIDSSNSTPILSPEAREQARIVEIVNRQTRERVLQETFEIQNFVASPTVGFDGTPVAQFSAQTPRQADLSRLRALQTQTLMTREEQKDFFQLSVQYGNRFDQGLSVLAGFAGGYVPPGGTLNVQGPKFGQPFQNTFIGKKTTGLLRIQGRDTPLVSGVSGPAKSIPKGTSGFDIVVRTHVEGHAAATMRQLGIREAELFINNPAICTSCNKLLPRMLPTGSKLDVFLPDGSLQTFRGN